MNDLNSYELLSNGTFNKLIRHYKIIKRNNYDDSVEEEIKSDENNKHNISIYNHIDALSQDTDNYDNKNIINYILINNIYKDVSLVQQCDAHKNFVLNGKEYDDLNNLKEDLQNKNNEANSRYMHEIENDDFNFIDLFDLKTTLKNYINGNSNNLYIRMAPNKNEKDTVLKRLYYLQNVEPIESINGIKHYLEDGIPVFNDNIIYSNIKYNKITENTVKEIFPDINVNKKIEKL